ncbi:MAG: right-handed parallel beta-helix repeat-containing protein, partial [Candidatus Desantisbacteria bacterium]
MKKVLVAIMLVGLTGIVEAVDLYVPSQYATIQAGINAANTGDTVWVADGIYTGASNKNLTWSSPKHITVRSVNGPANCIIDCGGSGRGFYFNNTGQNSSDLIQGFTIRKGYAAGSHGGGIYCNSSSPSILNCNITGNKANDGGGIVCWYSSPAITNCNITGNTAIWYGGGIDCYSSSPSITNCNITGNTANWGGGICCSNFSPSILNNIITGNTNYGIYRYSGGSPSIDYNDVWNNTPGNYAGCSAGANDISLDPQFIGGGNYHLQSISPCIDAGSNTAFPATITTDLDGNPRILGTVTDMGPYEWWGVSPLSQQKGRVGDMATIMGVVHSTQTLVRVDFGTYQTITTGTTNDGTLTLFFAVPALPRGTYTITIYGSIVTQSFYIDSSGNITPPSGQGPVGTVVYVDGDGYTPGLVYIDFGTHQTITTTIADASGSFSTSFVVDTQPGGTVIISIYDTSGSPPDTIPFFIQAHILLLPDCGNVNDMVTVIGTGFGTEGLVRIDFGVTKTITSTTLSTNGSFSATFIVDNHGSGQKIVTAEDTFTKIATAQFYIDPATVTITSTAPNLIKDGKYDDCLKIIVENQNTVPDGTITWKRLDVRITADGDINHQIDYNNIFGWIKLYKDANGDQGFDMSDTELQSVSPSGTITFSSISNGTISPSGSATYFVVAGLNNNASSAGSRTFMLTCDESGTNTGATALSNYWVNNSGVMVTLDWEAPGDEVSSTKVNVAPDAYLSLASNPDNQNIIDEEKLWFLKMTVNREAQVYYEGENVEFSSLTVKITPTSGTYTNTQAQAIFNQLLVYRSSDNSWEETDIVCGTKTGGQITLSDQGTITIGLDGTAIIASDTTRYYFFTIKTTGTASGQGSRTFNVQIDPQIDVCLEDNETNITFPHEYNSYSPTSQARPIPKIPEATATSTAPEVISNNQTDDLLRIKVIHTGTVGAGAIELNQATITFTASDTTTLMSTQDAKGLFETVSIYKDNGDGLWTLSDIEVGSCTNADLSLVDGRLTLVLPEDIGTTTGGTYTYYFLATKMKSDASSYGTTTFTSAIDPDTLRILDMKDNILLSPLPAQDTVTTGLVRAVAANPNIFGLDTSPVTIINSTED